MTHPRHWRTLSASSSNMKTKLGRLTDKPGRKNKVAALTPEQRTAIQVFGKFVRLDGYVVETADDLDRMDDFILI